MQKCLMCGDKFTTKPDLFEHYEEIHSSEFDDKMTGAQMNFFKLHSRITGKCRICGKDTNWNNATNLPFALCKNPNCTKEYRSMFVKRMKKVYGKEHLLNDPEIQKKMLANRSISGIYKWSDGAERQYVGSFELDFLRFLDLFYKFPSRDVMTPAPQVIHYKYEGKDHFYIPDVFIPSLNLIIEVKDGGNNPNTHPKIMAVDKEKEKLKDKAIKESKFNYVKVTNKDYGAFVNFLLTVDTNTIPEGKINIISESTAPETLSESIIANLNKNYFYYYLIEFDVTCSLNCKFMLLFPNDDKIMYFDMEGDNGYIQMKTLTELPEELLSNIVNVYAIEKLSSKKLIEIISMTNFNTRIDTAINKNAAIVAEDRVLLQILTSYLVDYNNNNIYEDMNHIVCNHPFVHQCYRSTLSGFLENIEYIENETLERFNNVHPYSKICESLVTKMDNEENHEENDVINNSNTNNKMNMGGSEEERKKGNIDEKELKMKEEKRVIIGTIRRTPYINKYIKKIINSHSEKQVGILKHLIYEDDNIEKHIKLSLLKLCKIREHETSKIYKKDMDIKITPSKIEEELNMSSIKRNSPKLYECFMEYKNLIEEGNFLNEGYTEGIKFINKRNKLLKEYAEKHETQEYSLNNDKHCLGVD